MNGEKSDWKRSCNNWQHCAPSEICLEGCGAGSAETRFGIVLAINRPWAQGNGIHFDNDSWIILTRITWFSSELPVTLTRFPLYCFACPRSLSMYSASAALRTYACRLFTIVPTKLVPSS